MGSSSVLPEWYQLRPTTKIGWFSVFAASLFGLYAAERCGRPHAASAMTALREKLPVCSTMPLIGSGGGSSAAATSTCAQSNADDSLSLAPMLVSLGKKVA